MHTLPAGNSMVAACVCLPACLSLRFPVRHRSLSFVLLSGKEVVWFWDLICVPAESETGRLLGIRRRSKTRLSEPPRPRDETVLSAAISVVRCQMLGFECGI